MWNKKIALLLMCALLTACGAVTQTPTNTPVNMEATQVAQYVAETKEVQQAVATQVQATQVVLMTETATNLPTATATFVPPTPTNTPVPTNTATPTATATPVICNAAQLVADMTIAKDDMLPGGITFTKVWRVKNVGTCTWTKDFSIVYDSGRQLGGSTTKLTKKVAPGETVDIAVVMKTPTEKGTYKGYWLLKDADGDTFGIGAGAKDALKIQLQVSGEAEAYAYDLAANFCQAAWKTDDTTIYCGGTKANKNYVQYANNFKMESGATEDEPVLLVTLGKQQRVRGNYPAYVVQPGDHFVSWIGCVAGSTDCRVVMRVIYKLADGTTGVLGEWEEVYDGSIVKMDLDLSALVGEEVTFILDMETKFNASQHQVFWFVPGVRNP